ncbi:DUF6228 family protein [Actinosynnema sp. CA-248983]
MKALLVSCEHPSPDAAVTVVSESGAWITFENPVDPYGDGSTAVCVEIGYKNDREHLVCRAHGVDVAVMEPEPLTPFLLSLAADYAGWDGTRTWQTMDTNLTATATHTGHRTTLTWTLRTWHHRPSPWEASVVLSLEPGEQLHTFATDLRHLLNLPLT